jgi:hypothetical protein
MRSVHEYAVEGIEREGVAGGKSRRQGAEPQHGHRFFGANVDADGWGWQSYQALQQTLKTKLRLARATRPDNFIHDAGMHAATDGVVDAAGANSKGGRKAHV